MYLWTFKVLWSPWVGGSITVSNIGQSSYIGEISVQRLLNKDYIKLP